MCAINNAGDIFVGGSTECVDGICCAVKKYKSDELPIIHLAFTAWLFLMRAAPMNAFMRLMCCDDGSLIVGGNTNVSRLKQDALLARLDRSGKLDKSFGKDGITITSFGGFDDAITALACDCHGTIYAGGRSDPLALMILSFALGRQLNSCEQHPLAHIDEKIIANFHGCSQEVKMLSIDKSGIMLISLTPFIGALPASIAAYTASGILDKSFGNKGICAPTIAQINEVISSFMIDPNPMLTTIGTEYEVPHKYLAMSRIKRDGTLDETFAARGTWHATAPLTQGVVHSYDFFNMINSSTIHDALADLPSDPKISWQRKIALKGWTEGDLCMALREKYAHRS